MAIPPLTSAIAAALRRGRVVALGAALLAAPLAAEPAYLTQPATLRAGPAEAANPLAELSVATEIEVIAREGAQLRVALHGWARPGAERVLLAYPGKQILLARLRPEAIDGLRRLDTTHDSATGATWHRVETVGWLPAAATSPHLEPVWEAAWALFSERCTACHERRVPQNYTANQWRSHLKVMGPRTGLPAAEQALILAFLQHHASDTIDLRYGRQR